MDLDAKNGNKLWREAELKELEQLDEYKVFEDKGPRSNMKGYKKIRVHMVYDIKHDGRRKARLVAGGHLTDTPIDSIYLSVISLWGLRIVIFLAELNKMEIWTTNVGNAYLEAYTEEKVYIIGDSVFGDREGHCLVIVKALYGLRSSGLRWWERLSKVLIKMGFHPTKAEDNIWI